MNRIQGLGIVFSAAGMLLFFGWMAYKLAALIDLPAIVEIALGLVILGFVVSLASLIYERSQDVKKEKFLK